MDEAKKYKIKAFLWDQFVRPVILLFNMHQIKAFLLALAILSVVLKWTVTFWVTVLPLGFIFVYEIIQYWKSGEWMRNYRKYKYPDYKKATKAFKRQEKAEYTKSQEKLNNDEEEENGNGEEREEVGTPSRTTSE